MEATAGVAEPLGEQPLDETVDVFVRTIHKRGIFLPAIEDVGERRLDFARLLACKDAGMRQRTRPRDAARHIVFE